MKGKNKMEQNYAQELRTMMEIKGYDNEYIDLCCSYAKELIKNKMPVIFDFKHLSLLLGYEPKELAFYLYAEEECFYNTVSIPKKRGGIRNIEIPSDRLKTIQKWILKNILENIKVSESCYGFCKGKSIYDNAVIHVGKNCVVNMDLKDFFSTIRQEDIFYIFYKQGYTKRLSYYFSKLLTKNGVLPQGSPASPMISNIVAKHLDERLVKLSAKYHAVYSRYADDITFSGGNNIKNIIPIVNQIIKEQKFLVNEEKTRYSYFYQRQEVTGLIVNKKVAVPKEYIKKLNQDIYYCKKFGVTSHLQKTNNQKHFFKEHIYGKAYFVNMIDKELGRKLLKELDSIEWEY